MFFLILLSIPALSFLWWWWVDGALRRQGAAGGWRAVVAVGMVIGLGGFAWVIAKRAGWVGIETPRVLVSFVLLWGLLALPFFALPMMVALGAARWLRRLQGREDAGNPKTPPLLRSEQQSSDSVESEPGAMTRRGVLRGALLSAPVLGTAGATLFSISQLRHFRIREITVELAGLPPALDGMRIAHLTDIHVGKFTRGAMLQRIADATNELKADLVLFTGDLLDTSVLDLPEALTMMERLDPRSGLYLIEGNHDLFDGVEPFVNGVRERGFRLLRDQADTLELRGERIQILGSRWPGRGSGSSMADSMETIAGLRDPDAFQIFLSHHPHAFDAAAALGIPLTLAGHTHGGQLMLTPEIGAGPMMFRYWSGLYKLAESALVVSNGAGNWFPVRTAAPADIIDLTLRVKSA